MAFNLVERYASLLSSLVGSAFQTEVSARLNSVMTGVQVVPQYPQGDGGIDCLSHNGSQAYCCYGPEPDVAKTDRGRASAIADKFTGDLRRLFELEMKKGRLVHSDNERLPTILAPGVRIRHITLISNWFRSHELIGKLQSALAECVANSQCRYVDPDVTLVVKGPRELASDHAVDEITMVRINQRTFLARVEATASMVAVADAPNFDAKISKLHQLVGPALSDVVDTLADNWRKYWRMALAFEHELDQTVPLHHQALQRARARLVTGVSMMRLTPKGPLDYITPTQDLAKEILMAEFRDTYEWFVDDLAHGETARLVGECTLDWDLPATVEDNHGT
jgi:hypothetical protein